MRAVLCDKLESGRVSIGPMASDSSYGPYGAFEIAGPCGRELLIVSAAGDETGWEHVSVSTNKYPPNWQEMCFVKDLFWREDECVMQLHPARANHINVHPNCLHLWRPTRAEIPLPNLILV
jgi:hypothetical protein